MTLGETPPNFLRKVDNPLIIYKPEEFVRTKAQHMEAEFVGLLKHVFDELSFKFYGTRLLIEVTGAQVHHQQMLMWFYRSEGWRVDVKRQDVKETNSEGVEKMITREFLMFSDKVES